MDRRSFISIAIGTPVAAMIDEKQQAVQERRPSVVTPEIIWTNNTGEAVTVRKLTLEIEDAQGRTLMIEALPNAELCGESTICFPEDRLRFTDV